MADIFAKAKYKLQYKLAKNSLNTNWYKSCARDYNYGFNSKEIARAHKAGYSALAYIGAKANISKDHDEISEKEFMAFIELSNRLIPERFDPILYERLEKVFKAYSSENLEGREFVKRYITRVGKEVKSRKAKTGMKRLSIYLYTNREYQNIYVAGITRGEYANGKFICASVGMENPLIEKACRDIVNAFSGHNIAFASVEFEERDGALELEYINLSPVFPAGLSFNPAVTDHIRKYFASGLNSYRLKGMSPKMIVYKQFWLWRILDLEKRGFTNGGAKKVNKEKYLAKKLGKYRVNVSQYKDKKLFQEKYEFYQSRPINGVYRKWFKNNVNIHYIFKPFNKYMDDSLYHVIRRNNENRFIPMNDDADLDANPYDVIKAFAEEKGSFQICDKIGSVLHSVSFNRGQYTIDSRDVSFEKVFQFIKNEDRELIILHKNELKNFNYINLYIMGDGLGKSKIIKAVAREGSSIVDTGDYEFDFNKDNPYISAEQREQVSKLATSIMEYAPFVNFIKLVLEVDNNDNVLIKAIRDEVDFEELADCPEYMALAKDIAEEKKAYASSFINRFNYVRKRAFSYYKFVKAKLFYPVGLVPYLSWMWPKNVKEDRKYNKNSSKETKKWAYAHGFLSHRIAQYGITEENWQDYLADFEYRWLRHINSNYKEWLEDKMTIKYVGVNYKQYLPAYYYQVVQKSGITKITPLLDCEDKDKTSMSDVLDLIKAKGIVAMKPGEGSHGDGFYRTEYHDGKYFLNFKEATEQDVIDILTEEGNAYLVTEFIVQHPKTAEIYPKAVNTIRLLVFKKDGFNPEIANTYIRIGTEATGTIDNVSAGGMIASIDPITGEYGDARLFKDGEIIPTDCHPDTKVPIKGVMPNWDKVRQIVLDIAKDLREIEWFGFDIAITEDGIKIPEINRSPDYPKIEKYKENVSDYLMFKLKMKKIETGVLLKKQSKVHLPKRDYDDRLKALMLEDDSLQKAIDAVNNGEI
ncbi:MAG: hypothetical protein MJ145_02950 [Clostridia bacterium]|nr:hypothetical protein [Clostridia bacterium]